MKNDNLDKLESETYVWHHEKKERETVRQCTGVKMNAACGD